MDNGNRSNSSGSLNGNKQLNRTSLKIGGMTCAACSARVREQVACFVRSDYGHSKLGY